MARLNQYSTVVGIGAFTVAVCFFCCDQHQTSTVKEPGTEGIDTIGTEAIFIYEGSSWNEALVAQEIARATRFKSHFHLPKNEQIVYVHRLLIVKPNDVDTINKINKI